MTSVTLQKAARLLKSRGPISLIKVSASQLLGHLRAYWAVRGLGPVENIKQAVDFAWGFGGVIQPVQLRSEILGLMQLVQALKPKTVLEIGTDNGGTLFLWTRVAAPDATLISVDLPCGDFGGGYPVWKAPLYRSFAHSEQTVKLARADSHDPATVENVRQLLQGRSVDFLFIDGDHRYEGVKRDYEMYSKLVTPGGIIAFHDIAPPPIGDAAGVDRFWHEIKNGLDYRELIDNPSQRGFGIGVVRVEREHD